MIRERERKRERERARARERERERERESEREREKERERGGERKREYYYSPSHIARREDANLANMITSLHPVGVNLTAVGDHFSLNR